MENVGSVMASENSLYYMLKYICTYKTVKVTFENFFIGKGLFPVAN